jgi:hypothetical protein
MCGRQFTSAATLMLHFANARECKIVHRTVRCRLGIPAIDEATVTASSMFRAFAAFVVASFWVGAACYATNIAPAASPSAPVLKPDSGPWDAGRGFDLNLKTRQSVSGIACIQGSGNRVCLLVFDEGVEARHAVIREGVLSPESEPLVLIESGRELDAEGATSDGVNFYVTGSHSTSRTRCAANLQSRQVIRFNVDPKSGRAQRDPNGKLSGYQASGRLWEIISTEATLKQYAGKCLGTQPPEKSVELKGERGINVEGIASKDGHLYFGFRGPARDGVAPILSVHAETLFGDRPARSATYRVAVGEGRGIRDLLAVKDGFLVLTGPDDDERKEQPSSMILFWDGKGSSGAVVQTRPLAELDVSNMTRIGCDTVTKPEAIALLSESSREYKVLVLSDGMCDGGPLPFTVPR